MSDVFHIKKERLAQIIKLIKFLLTLDDLEVIKSTLESIVEILEEETNTENHYQ